MVAACDAADGSHWALQRWARLWDNYGGRSAKKELHLSHWTGDVGVLEIKTDWSYRGKHEHLWGPLHVPRQARLRQPLDDQRACRSTAAAATSTSITTRTASGSARTRSSRIPAPRASATRSRSTTAAYGVGDAYRATVIGPGVSPLVRVGFSPPGTHDRALDDAANEEQRALLGDDRRCKINGQMVGLRACSRRSPASALPDRARRARRRARRARDRRRRRRRPVARLRLRLGHPGVERGANRLAAEWSARIVLNDSRPQLELIQPVVWATITRTGSSGTETGCTTSRSPRTRSRRRASRWPRRNYPVVMTGAASAPTATAPSRDTFERLGFVIEAVEPPGSMPPRTVLRL